MTKKNTIRYNGIAMCGLSFRHSLSIIFLILFYLIMPGRQAMAQQTRTVKGSITDRKQEPIIGATVTVKGTTIRAATDVNGTFSIKVPENARVLTVTYTGMVTQDVNIAGKETVKITLQDDVTALSEVAVVGYGVQRKASVVGAISQTNSAVLERTGGVSSLGAALTGNVPGVITSASSGMPGDEDPQILIRGRSTWNNASPLILVDGVERSINNIDISSVESVSVLKDASATAVFGVRGANGVIIITTKRGREGKASIRGNINTIAKVPSKLPGKYDAYDALKVRNRVIEYELALNPNSWLDYQPEKILQKYRNPANVEESERYPNVDWAKTLFKDYAMSYNANLNISGGTKFVKYFNSVDFLREGDLFRQFDNNRGYEPGYGFNRVNVRSNLDFQLTPTTAFHVNLAGSTGRKKSPWGATGSEYSMWIAAYNTAPDAFLPRYSDGTWGYYAPDPGKAENSVRTLAMSGIQYLTTSKITTDFTLDQSLSMIAKGLNFKGTISLDNTFVEGNRGINDLYNDSQSKFIDPASGTSLFRLNYDGASRFDFQEGVKWTAAPGAVLDAQTQRRIFYQLQLNYATVIAKNHNVTAMGLFNRNQQAAGSTIPSYREDWVFRTTYNYKGKYLIEYNGAYNGSEKFGPNYRFAFFSSGGAGWLISEEKFLKSVSFIDMLKLRGSYGKIGDDNVNGRWLYQTQWGYGGTSRLGSTGEAAEQSPYAWYRETSVGNENVRWEKVEKINLGTDFAFFKNAITGSFDAFQDTRSDILTGGNGRAVPSYYGATAPVANLGKVRVRGFEFDVKLSKNLNRNLRLWGNINFTHAKDQVLQADNAALLPDYQKNEGKQIGQVYSYVSKGYYNNWDELYATTQYNTNDGQKLPGNYQLVDYNGDGIIDNRDNIPYGFSSSPQNTYNLTIGFDWKGFSAFAQFYAANNVTRQVVLPSLAGQNHTVYEEGSYWSKDDMNADVPMPRWLTTPADFYSGSRYMFDGSYVRLKTAEISYVFNKNFGFIKRAGMESLRIFLNGNNLAVWTKMPDDRESNFAGTGWASQGAYPTVKRFNCGAYITF